MTVLKFGKFKGRDIRDVPVEYLTYLVREAERTIAECTEELERREAAAEAEAPWVQRIVETGYRSLATRFHPDVAGSDGTAMVELNAAIAKLRELVRQE